MYRVSHALIIYVRTFIEMALEYRLDPLGETLTIFAATLDAQSTASINPPAHSTKLEEASILIPTSYNSIFLRN